MPLLRLQHFATSARIAKTDLAEVEAAFDEDIKTLEAASSPRNVAATTSHGDSPVFRPETECVPVLSFCLSFLDMGPIFTDRETVQSALHVKIFPSTCEYDSQGQGSTCLNSNIYRFV